MLIEDGEIQAGQYEGFDVVEGSEIVVDACERIRGDPSEVFVLREVQRTNVVTGRPQANLGPRLDIEEGVQLDVYEEMAATPMDPVW